MPRMKRDESERLEAARQRGFLVCRERAYALEAVWRQHCKELRFPFITVRTRRAMACVNYDLSTTDGDRDIGCRVPKQMYEAFGEAWCNIIVPGSRTYVTAGYGDCMGSFEMPLDRSTGFAEMLLSKLRMVVEAWHERSVDQR